MFPDAPSLVGLAFLIQSVRWRTKSKKKSSSGTEMTLSAILTKRLNPSSDLSVSLCEMLWQKSLARVDESTSKAYGHKQLRRTKYIKNLLGIEMKATPKLSHWN